MIYCLHVRTTQTKDINQNVEEQKQNKTKNKQTKNWGNCCNSHETLGFFKCILIETIVHKLKSEKQQLKTNVYSKITDYTNLKTSIY